MPSKPASDADVARGKRLEKWLERVAPNITKSYRGQVVLEVPRQTVRNWIKGSDISNDGICRIVEVGGYEALAYILGMQPFASRSKNTQRPEAGQIHGKGARFWYNQYIREKARTVLEEKQDYSKFPASAQGAMRTADDFARIQGSHLRASGSKNPRMKKYDFQ